MNESITLKIVLGQDIYYYYFKLNIQMYFYN